MKPEDYAWNTHEREIYENGQVSLPSPYKIGTGANLGPASSEAACPMGNGACHSLYGSDRYW